MKKKIALLLSFVMLAGCGLPKEMHAGNTYESESVVGLETVPVLDYEIPTLLPGVLLNQAGYSPASEKIAVICGENLPTQFHIIDAVTEEKVYTGKLEMQCYDADSLEYIGYGDFTDFATEGEYYVECDILGCSYPFTIKASCYEDMMAEGFAILAEREQSLTKEDLTKVCRCLSTLLLSYELYAPVYESGQAEGAALVVIEQTRRYAELLLGWQDAETGAVLSGEAVLLTETAWLSAALAKFSYTYQKFDSVYATVCLQAADRAWKYLEKQKAEMETDAMLNLRFFAAAELYRATGKYEYHAAVKQLGQSLTLDANAEAQAFGTLTYASTKRTVDVELCGTLLGVLLDEAESIAEKAKDNVFMVGSSLTKETISETLWDAVVIAAMDYVITNSEYASVLEHYQNYLAGANEMAHCYVYGVEEETRVQGIGADSADTAKYIMMLSEIMSHKQEE